MKIYCPYCRVALDYDGSNLAICRCASCGERFIFHDNYEYVMPYEEETTTSIFEENPKSQTLIAQEQEDRIRADYEKFVVRMGSAASSTANWSVARKAEAIRDMKITGNYFEID